MLKQGLARYGGIMSALRAALTDADCSLFKTEKLSDFTIVCGPHGFKVHKAILCAQSEYFGALPNFAVGPEDDGVDEFES